MQPDRKGIKFGGFFSSLVEYKTGSKNLQYIKQLKLISKGWLKLFCDVMKSRNMETSKNKTGQRSISANQSLSATYRKSVAALQVDLSL